MLSKKQIYKKAYDKFFGIETVKDLDIHKLSFMDHSVAYDVMKDLYIGKLEKPAFTFNKNVADWFKKNGFTVVLDGVNYKISL